MREEPNFKIDPIFLARVPQYLSQRRQEMFRVKSAIDSGDFETITCIGHNVSGNAGTFGFSQLGVYAKAMENAAKERDLGKAKQYADLMSEYLESNPVDGPTN